VSQWTTNIRENSRYPSRIFGHLPLFAGAHVNEYEYCPRLAYLEWVQGEWAESGDTAEAGISTGAWTSLPVTCRNPE